jgi:uncharacterized protein (DUF305 family)
MPGRQAGWAVAVVVSGALLIGCTSATAEDTAGDTEAPKVIQPGAPGEPSRELTPAEAAELEAELEAALQHTEADVAFMQGMIAHHVQALRMTRLVPSRTVREDIPLFAERMDLSQEDEIALMQRWLEERGEEVPSLLAGHEHDGHDGDDELMPGMLTEEELAELESLEGQAFDRRFLESMIRHHLGALQMVDDLHASDGGQEPEIARFARHVVSDQQIELTRMYDLLAALDGEAG